MSGRYTIVGTLASGGMGTVYLGRMVGSAGFARLVAVKRLHPELAAQHDFIAMLVDEARLAAQIRHVNVIDTLDLVASDGAFSLILEYVEGAALSSLLRSAEKKNEPIPQDIALTIIRGVLRGLDAAHEARSPEGQPLGLVHRDVSPQNVLVGTDGIPRVIDFGIAKAMGRMASTRPGEVRGKFSYMAPEQLLERPATRQADVYAAGVVLWELLACERLFANEDPRAVVAMVLRGEVRSIRSVRPDIAPELEAIVMRATASDLGTRYLTARDMLDDLASFEFASDEDVGDWVRRMAAEQLAKKDALLQNVAAEGNRSMDDLVAELAQSVTPPHAMPIIDPTAPTIRAASGDGIEVVAPYSERTPSSQVAQASNLIWLWLIVPVVTLTVGALVLGGFLGMRHGRATAVPPEPTAVPAPIPPPPAVATTTDENQAASVFVAPVPPPAAPAPPAASHHHVVTNKRPPAKPTAVPSLSPSSSPSPSPTSTRDPDLTHR